MNLSDCKSLYPVPSSDCKSDGTGKEQQYGEDKLLTTNGVLEEELRYKWIILRKLKETEIGSNL
ncbi:MAG: hypothetical protein H6Q17_2187 [Bacteroidetes bacterium]|nr:hypothetical protein [Bacteroidota bacterium]